MTFNSENRETIARNRLWVLTEIYYPEETSTGYYLTRIAEGLAENFDVKVLCGQPNYSARGIKARAREVHKNVEIFRVFGTTLNKNVIPLRLVNMATISVSMFINAVTKFRSGDRVLVVTNPPTLPFIAAAAAKLRGAVYTLLIHDNYPEILIAAGKTRRDSALVRFANFCNRWLYKHASKIIAVGRDMNELLMKKAAGLDVPIATIPNWAELESVSPADRNDNALLKELGLEDKFVFLYAGNMGYPNDVESIIESAEILGDHDRIHFVFLGAGVKRDWIIEESKRRSLRNVTVLDPRPRSEQQTFLNACDVAFVSLVPSMKGVSMPSRTYNILAAGKPILAIVEEDSETARVVYEESVGWVVPPGNPDTLAETVLEVLARRSDLPELGRRARAAAVEKYSLSAAIDKYSVEIS